VKKNKDLFKKQSNQIVKFLLILSGGSGRRGVEGGRSGGRGWGGQT